MISQVHPTSVCIEASASCQLACPGCKTPTHEIGPSRRRGSLGIEDFRKIVDDNPSLRHIELSNNGEMFLNPDLLSIMKYAHRRGVRLTAANGVNFNHVLPEVLEGLVEYGFFALTISIDGCTPETYETYRKKGKLEAVLGNIRALNAVKKRLASPLPHLVWQFIVFGHNEHEIVPAAFQAHRLGMQIRYKLQWDDEFSPVIDGERVAKIVGAATRADYRKKHGQSYMSPICRQLWVSPVIDSDGTVLGCCKNWWGTFGANVFREGLSDAVNAEPMRYARQMLQGAAPPRNDIPCTTCDVYRDRASSAAWVTQDEIEGHDGTAD